MEILYGVIAAVAAALVIIAVVLLVLKLRSRVKPPVEEKPEEKEKMIFDDGEFAEEAGTNALINTMKEADVDNDSVYVSLTGDAVEPQMPTKDIITVIATPIPKKKRKKRVRVTAPVHHVVSQAESEMEKAETEQRLEAERIEKSLRKPGMIQIYKDAGDRFRFRVKTATHETVAHSQGYTTKTACKNGIRIALEIAETSEVIDTTKEVTYRPCIGQSVFEIYRDNEDKFRFRLRAPNAMNLLASQGYITKANCKNGIRAARHLILNHRLVDDTKQMRKEEVDLPIEQNDELPL